MKKGVFVLHEGIGNTIFDSQIAEHIRYCGKKNYQMDILVYNTEAKVWANSVNNLRRFLDLKIFLKKGINIYTPLSFIYHLVLLIIFFYKNNKKYDFIHARANYTGFLCILIGKFFKIKVLWDCRGDSLAELKEALNKKSILVRIYGFFYLLPFERLQIYILCKYADAAIFVSESLKSMYDSDLSTDKIEIIPCLVNEEKFFYDKEMRKSVRSKYLINDEDKVIIYSGSMVSYQGLEKQKEFFRKILSERFIVYYLTSDINDAKIEFSEFTDANFKIASSPFEKMNEFYNMADYALLLRDSTQVNFVASPTKFGEYCLTGLGVITNNAISQVYINSKNIGNYVDSFEVLQSNNLEWSREKISEKSKLIYSRTRVFYKYELLYEKL